MYLMINGNRHSVSRRMVTKDTIKFLTVEPKPETVSGMIRMYENGGFLISEDNADDYLRSVYSGTLLTLTNTPATAPVAQENKEQTQEEKREAAYNNEATIEWDGELITVTQAAQLWQYYAAEGSTKADELTALIAKAKQDIREEYPDET